MSKESLTDEKVLFDIVDSIIQFLDGFAKIFDCLLYTSPSPRDRG